MRSRHALKNNIMTTTRTNWNNWRVIIELLTPISLASPLSLASWRRSAACSSKRLSSFKETMWLPYHLMNQSNSPISSFDTDCAEVHAVFGTECSALAIWTNPYYLCFTVIYNTCIALTASWATSPPIAAPVDPIWERNPCNNHNYKLILKIHSILLGILLLESPEEVAAASTENSPLKKMVRKSSEMTMV